MNLPRKLAATAATAALLASGSVVLASPAGADTPNCVSKREYNRVNGTHMRMARAHRIFDVSGSAVWVDRNHVWYQMQDRVYRRCGGGYYDQMYKRRYVWIGVGLDSHLGWTAWRAQGPYLD